MATTVHVNNIAGETTEKEVRDFFSFCGKISNLSVSSDGEKTKSAIVTFEKETAAKTALLLDNTQLGPSQVHVTSPSQADEAGRDETGDAEYVAQEDKPRSRIVAEYLAHGYAISDKIIERAIALDKQHGVSDRFSKTLADFDRRYRATERAKAADDRTGLTRSATMAWNGFHSYFDKAINTETGRQLRKFYEEGNKQVVDVHNEARHLANLKSGKPAAAPGATPGNEVAAPEPSDEAQVAEKASAGDEKA